MKSRPKTWIELSRSALENNISTIRSLLPGSTELFAVVKSNAYGHGLSAFSSIANETNVDGLCVDSVIEGAKLRQLNIKKPILVLGPTMPNLFDLAVQNKLTLSISTQDTLEELAQIEAAHEQPEFHLKVETGMHRQGFELPDLKKALKFIRKHQLKLAGIYSHFSSAKDPVYPSYSADQFKQFQLAITLAESEEFRSLKKHIAASAGIMHSQEYALDRVRVGMSLYGFFYSKELENHLPNLDLKPVFSWHTIITELKKVSKGDYVGYDQGERMTKDAVLAILPVGYWHGLDGRLSKQGEVLIKGRRARIVGKISMDVTVVDVTEINCEREDKVTIIGSSGKEKVLVPEWSWRTGASHYELLTKINPLIKKEIVA